MEAGSYKSIFGPLEGRHQGVIHQVVTSHDGSGLLWGESTNIGLLVEVQKDAKHCTSPENEKKDLDTCGC